MSVWLGLIAFPEVMTRYNSSYSTAQVAAKTLESDGFDWTDSIVDISNRPYWSRVWVIQEFLLGQNVELYCSDNRIDWTFFQELVCREADINQSYDINDAVPRGDRTKELGALSLVMGRHTDKHPEFLQPLCNLLIDHHRSKCKDPRDKVFAMMGLILLDERESQSRFFPDYTISEDHVRIITVAFLTQFPSMSRMERAGDKITADSDELFLGLGVRTKSERKRLLRRAAEIDYLGLSSAHQLSQYLTLEDQREEYESHSIDEDQGLHETERSRSSSKIMRILSAVTPYALVTLCLIFLKTVLKK